MLPIKEPNRDFYQSYQFIFNILIKIYPSYRTFQTNIWARCVAWEDLPFDLAKLNIALDARHENVLIKNCK